MSAQTLAPIIKLFAVIGAVMVGVWAQEKYNRKRKEAKQ